MNEQQNPFATQEKRYEQGDTPRMLISHNIVSVGVLGRIPVRPVKSGEAPSERPWLGGKVQQASFLSPLEQVAVIFPRTSRITINEEGVFVPRSVFGDDADVRADVNRSRRGVRIVLSSFADAVTAEAAQQRVVNPVDRTREMRWLEEHHEEYAGQWVALDGERLLGYGEDAREVYLSARAAGVARPFVMRLESEEPLPFGGW